MRLVQSAEVVVQCSPDGPIPQALVEGLWLGVEEEIGHDTIDRTVALERGDVALFHTDGVTEARDAKGECYDVERLTKQLVSLHRRPATEIVTEIAQAAWRWAGTPADDVSLMAVKRN